MNLADYRAGQIFAGPIVQKKEDVRAERRSSGVDGRQTLPYWIREELLVIWELSVSSDLRPVARRLTRAKRIYGRERPIPRKSVKMSRSIVWPMKESKIRHERSGHPHELSALPQRYRV